MMRALPKSSPSFRRPLAAAALTVAITALTALAALATLAVLPARAQSKSGTTIGQFLLIEPSARFSGMGNVGVAISDGLQSVYYNAAALGPIEQSSLELTHSEWIAGIRYDYAALALPMGGYGTLLGSVTSLGSGEIDVRTVEQPLGTGERYTVSNVAVGLGMGREITRRFSAGVQLNYVQETIWHSSLRTVTMNLGSVYQVSEDGLRIGSSISNLGTRARFRGRDLAIQYDNDPDRNGDNSSLPGERLTDEFAVPILFRVGLAWPRELSPRSRVLMSADAFHPSDNEESVSLGAEWSWKEAFALRAGYQNAGLPDAESGATWGAGFRGDLGPRPFEFDYGWADQGRLDETHRLTFVLSF